MNPREFANLPEMPANGKREITELHVCLCDPPRPVAARVKQGYKLLPSSLWGVAELVARAAQGLDINPIQPCSTTQFLAALLAQVIVARGVLAFDVVGEGVLSLLISQEGRGNPAKMLALPAPPLTPALEHEKSEPTTTDRETV
jgi:hypothetical protein